jgi:hypothetical protein
LYYSSQSLDSLSDRLNGSLKPTLLHSTHPEPFCLVFSPLFLFPPLSMKKNI